MCSKVYLGTGWAGIIVSRRQVSVALTSSTPFHSFKGVQKAAEAEESDTAVRDKSLKRIQVRKLCSTA